MSLLESMPRCKIVKMVPQQLEEQRVVHQQIILTSFFWSKIDFYVFVYAIWRDLEKSMSDSQRNAGVSKWLTIGVCFLQTGLVFRIVDTDYLISRICIN